MGGWFKFNQRFWTPWRNYRARLLRLSDVIENPLPRLRARNDSKLQDVARHMTFTKGESVDLLRGLCYEPDVIYLDPMYPEKKKKAESKKKMQVLHQIEPPCQDEIDLMEAARVANPTKIVIKRPPEADYLAGVTPTYSVERKAVRYDCLVLN